MVCGSGRIDPADRMAGWGVFVGSLLILLLCYLPRQEDKGAYVEMQPDGVIVWNLAIDGPDFIAVRISDPLSLVYSASG